MSFLKKLFKRKEGGTTFGNILRGVAKTAKSVIPVPGLAALPIGEGLMMKQETDAVPAFMSTLAPSPFLGGGTFRTVLDGAVEGAKNGAMDTYLNKTPQGQEVVKDAAANQLEKYLPWALGAAVLYLAVKNAKK